MFKVGDIITGLAKTQYTITNSLGTYEVVGIVKSKILVEVLTHEESTEYIGRRYTVAPNKFQLVESVNPQAAVLKKIAHLRNLFENRKQEKVVETKYYKQEYTMVIDDIGDMPLDDLVA